MGVWIFGLCGRGMVCVPSFFLDFFWGSDESDNGSAMMWGKERRREVKEREQTPLVTEDQPGIRMQNITENRWW